MKPQQSQNMRGSSQLIVTGWRNSKAASESDGGVHTLIKWLERKASIIAEKQAKAEGISKRRPIRIRKSRIDQDNNLIITVLNDDVRAITGADGFTWAGVTIRLSPLVENGKRPRTPPKAPRASSHRNNPASSMNNTNILSSRRTNSNTAPIESAELKSKLKRVLELRYNMERKELDLSALVTDPIIQEMGIEDLTTTPKLFGAIMTICEEVFPTRELRKEGVVGVILKNNNLSKVATISQLAYTFPDLRNLDLSDNSFTNSKNLFAWALKFKQLEHIILLNNPLVQNEPNYDRELTRRFRTLKFIDQKPVTRTRDRDVVMTTQEVSTTHEVSMPTTPAPLPAQQVFMPPQAVPIQTQYPFPSEAAPIQTQVPLPSQVPPPPIQGPPIAAQPDTLPAQDAAISVEAAEDPRVKAALEISRRTGMNLKYSWQCLEETGFNFEAALAAFERVNAEGHIPAEAFTQ